MYRLFHGLRAPDITRPGALAPGPDDRNRVHVSPFPHTASAARTLEHSIHRTHRSTRGLASQMVNAKQALWKDAPQRNTRLCAVQSHPARRAVPSMPLKRRMLLSPICVQQIAGKSDTGLSGHPNMRRIAPCILSTATVLTRPDGEKTANRRLPRSVRRSALTTLPLHS